MKIIKQALKFVVITFAIILLLVVSLIAIQQFGYSKNRELGQEIIGAIENYKKTNGKLPDDIAILGYDYDESGPIFYQKEDNGGYIIWYGKGLGESDTYDSKTHKWND